MPYLQLLGAAGIIGAILSIVIYLRRQIHVEALNQEELKYQKDMAQILNAQKDLINAKLKYEDLRSGYTPHSDDSSR